MLQLRGVGLGFKIASLGTVGIWVEGGVVIMTEEGGNDKNRTRGYTRIHADTRREKISPEEEGATAFGVGPAMAGEKPREFQSRVLFLERCHFIFFRSEK